MITIILLLIIYFFVSPSSVQAYLDPGTGSYFTQVVIGFAVGGSYLIKVYWHQLSSLIKKLLTRKKNDEIKKDS